MLIISIDVGIHNLAYSIFKFNPQTNGCKLVDWKVCSLNYQHLQFASLTCNNVLCQKKPICYQMIPDSNDKLYWCKTHTKSNVVYPTKNLTKCTKLQLNEKIKSFSTHLNLTTKKDMIAFLKTKQAIPLVQKKANTLSLIEIGQSIMHLFQNLNLDYTQLYVLIENQISPIASRMKSIQAMITQFFIMKHVKNIFFISSSQKLSLIDHSGNKNKTTYALRKKHAITLTNSFLKNHEALKIFANHNKKDDLADSFLQGITWIKKKYNVHDLTIT